jgi:hypothetical protein
MQKLAVATCLASALAAQVQPGEAIVSVFSNLAPLDGLMTATRAGTCTPVTGLSALAIQNINSVALDPIDDTIWIGSISTAPTTHGLRSLRIDAANAVIPASLALRGTLPTAPTGSISGIDFDLNCNPVVTSGAVPPGTGGVFMIDRNTGAVTNLLAPHPALPAGTANCIDVDPGTGTLYFGVTSPGAPIYRMTPNAVGAYTTAPVLVGTIAPPSTSSTISGLSFVPPASIFWTTFGTAVTCFGSLPAGGGAAVAIPGVTNPWNAPNWVEYDGLARDMWVLSGGINPDTLWTTDAAGVNPVVCLLPPGGVNGSPSCVDVNDSRPGTLKVCPRFVPAVPAVVNVEISLWWRPGDIGALAIEVAPGNFVLLNVGRIDRAGCFVLRARVVLGAGTPGVLRFYGACIAPDLSVIRGITGPVLWPAN